MIKIRTSKLDIGVNRARQDYLGLSDGVNVSFIPSTANYTPTVSSTFTAANMTYSTPAWIDYTGITGNRMYYDSTGTLTWAPANLIPTSATLTTQTITNGVTAGGTYILSAELAAGASVAVTGGATATLDTGSSSISGRYYITLSALSSATLTLTVSGTVTNAQLERVTNQTQPRTLIPTTGSQVFLPRYDYNPADNSARGLLIEESRQNLLLQSQDIMTTWSISASGITRTSNTAVAPDGTTTADTIATNGANTFALLSQTYTTSGTITVSVYVKQISGDTVFLRLTGADVGTAGQTQIVYRFNFSTAAWTRLVGGTVTSTKVENVGNSWYRIALTLNTTSVNAYYLYPAYNSAASNSLYVWGMQSEVGAFLTSYIPTYAAAITRSADSLQMTGDGLTITGANTGSAIVQSTQLFNVGAIRDILSSSASRRLLYSNSSNTVLSSTDGTTILTATIGSSGTFTGGAVRSATAWSATGRSLVASNGTLTSDATNLSTGANVYFGGSSTTPTFNGWIGSMALYNQRLPATTLKAKSTVGATY